MGALLHYMLWSLVVSPQYIVTVEQVLDGRPIWDGISEKVVELQGWVPVKIKQRGNLASEGEGYSANRTLGASAPIVRCGLPQRRQVSPNRGASAAGSFVTSPDRVRSESQASPASWRRVAYRKDDDTHEPRPRATC